MHMFPEAFLHFVWKILYFDFNHLFTTDGRPVRILKNGVHNLNQGPDFSGAVILIGDTEWSGNVEIHVNSGEWYAHKHQLDEKYNSVILHVVFATEGKPVVRQDGSVCPEIVIGNRIPATAFERYAVLNTAKSGIPCASLIGGVSDFHRFAWIERLGILRMAEKFGKISDRNESLMNWEQVAWELIMRYMGGTLNGEVFERIAGGVPFSVLKKYAQNPLQMEALLFGFVWDSTGESFPEESEPYIRSIAEEYRYLKHKHSLLPQAGIGFSYFRMRPASFPDIRLAQVVQLVSLYPDLMSLFLLTNFTDFFRRDIGVSEYWLSHFRVGVVSKVSSKNIGKDRKESLIINAFVPLAYGYRSFHGVESAESHLEAVLGSLPPEKNAILEGFSDLGIHAANAIQSQGIIHLKKQFCDLKRCLECGIGAKILKG
ncbi:MAG: DUF2851 family protein [Bacteroidia bacterium]|nr:DUF2851 family protein [Bacteroidia bacterium]